jgi:hypothetical protein
VKPNKSVNIHPAPVALSQHSDLSKLRRLASFLGTMILQCVRAKEPLPLEEGVTLHEMVMGRLLPFILSQTDEMFGEISVRTEGTRRDYSCDLCLCYQVRGTIQHEPGPVAHYPLVTLGLFNCNEPTAVVVFDPIRDCLVSYEKGKEMEFWNGTTWIDYQVLLGPKESSPAQDSPLMRQVIEDLTALAAGWIVFR